MFKLNWFKKSKEPKVNEEVLRNIQIVEDAVVKIKELYKEIEENNATLITKYAHLEKTNPIYYQWLINKCTEDEKEAKKSLDAVIVLRNNLKKLSNEQH